MPIKIINFDKDSYTENKLNIAIATYVKKYLETEDLIKKGPKTLKSYAAFLKILKDMKRGGKLKDSINRNGIDDCPPDMEDWNKQCDVITCQACWNDFVCDYLDQLDKKYDNSNISEIDTLFPQLTNSAWAYKKPFMSRVFMPRVDELITFLRDKDNLLKFWKNPHIKMIYDISNVYNFLSSIYTEETNAKVYEDRLYANIYNPLSGGIVVNYSILSKYVSGYLLDRFVKFISDYENGKMTQFTDDNIKDFIKARILKKVQYGKLLDKRIFDENLEMSCSKKTLEGKIERFVLLLNPLFFMGTNFNANIIRLDTYNAWRNTLKQEWSELRKYKDADDMFKILDALVESRKSYMEYVKKNEQKSVRLIMAKD